MHMCLRLASEPFLLALLPLQRFLVLLLVDGRGIALHIIRTAWRTPVCERAEVLERSAAVDLVQVDVVVLDPLAVFCEDQCCAAVALDGLADCLQALLCW